MDDLISRQKVCDWLKWYGNDAVKEGYKPSMIYAWKYIRDQIPSTDVREVVTCAECKHSDTFPEDGEVHEMPLKCLGIRYGGVMGDWYCEHGERRADDGEG